MKTRIVFALASMALTAQTSAQTSSTPNTEAASEPFEDRECVDLSQATGFTIVDADTVKLKFGPAGDYSFDVKGADCAGIDGTDVVIQSVPLRRLCVGKQRGSDTIGFKDTKSNKAMSCAIDSITKVEKALFELQPPAPEVAKPK